MKNFMKKDPWLLFIPNMISLLNFFSGFVSIVMISQGHLRAGSWLIFGALMLDSLDGNIARIFNNMTPLGRELDSLADLASFVIAPAFLALTFLGAGFDWAVLLVTFFYLVCGIFRLARFNTHEPVNGYFEGLPTPAASIVISMTVLACLKNHWDGRFVMPWLLFFSGTMMVSKIHYPKVSVLPFSKWKILFFLEIAVLIIIFKFFNIETTFAAMILTYIFFGSMSKKKMCKGIAFLVRFAPRNWTAAIVQDIQDRKK